LVQELLIALPEAMAIVRDSGAWHRRVAVARMVVEGWRASLGDVVARGLKTIVNTLVEDGGRSRWRRGRRIVNGLRMSTSGEQRSGKKGRDGEFPDQGFLRGPTTSSGLLEQTRSGGKVARDFMWMVTQK
jgi:hypothetical protein